MAVKITKVLSTNSPSTKVINIKFDIGDFGDGIKKVEDTFTFAMSKDSSGVYKIGKDVEKFCGIKEADVLKQISEGKDRPEDAIIYGLTNIMNGGKDIYMWVNGTRYQGMSKVNGPIPAMIEVLSHEATHLSKLILTRHIAKTKKLNLTNEEWVKYNYGAGAYNWPTNGDLNDKNKLIQVSDETFATLVGLVSQEIAPHFLKFSEKYNGR
jgi:hypothetical protein